MKTVLEVEELTVDIPTEQGEVHAVKGVSFNLNEGETLCLVGESGSGKSMTALSIIGLQTPKARIGAKRLTLLGKPLHTLSQRQLDQIRGKDIAIIFQDPMTALNPTLTIERQMIEGMMRHEGVNRRTARERAIDLLNKVGIPQAAERLYQYPHQFSGGQRQRIMIAMALMGKPSLLIADEPTTALDVTIQAQILELIRSLSQQLNFSLLMITHDFGVVSAMADKVCVMYQGEIVESGTAREVLEHPRHPYTQGLIACIPVPGRTAPGSRLPVIEHPLLLKEQP
ncbi:ABC transporter ATP-binding protein [Oceanisphaera psychrotolerans]|uniref:ABC-type dipeptide transporter n=1 Tax=Oceanisphaera psychrotolerans TaxID=1414654 RepID=A0A1J4QH74_9GAMM|nr:ABC transporter ATP-binding protein [Oceanisphaera psychrotolerans]OIN12220.1 peptide ABC transporter substrate-binding protein [Oceanisphaera psychrotolerans]